MKTKKEAIAEAYANGRSDFKNEVFELMDEYLETMKEEMELFPRNSKFVELQVDAIEELKQKIIYQVRVS
jgi:tryptophanyl-tRNA synthetase